MRNRNPNNRAMRRRTRRRTMRNRKLILGLLSPWLIGVAVFFLYPLGATVYYSFTSFDMLTPARWVGLRNYSYMLHGDPYLWQALRNTAWVMAILVPCQLLFALGSALVLTRIKRGAGLFRTLFYLPSLAPPVAATIAFVFLFNPGTGPVNTILRWFGIQGPLWFTDPHWAKPGLVLLALWGAGNTMVIFLAALLDVPVELHEAAACDGAGPLRRLITVTLPTIRPVLLFSLVTGMIGGLQYFTQAVVAGEVASGSADITASSGAPGYPDGSTLTFPYWLYAQGFQRFNMGYACALGVVLFAIAIGFTAVLLRRTEGFAA